MAQLRQQRGAVAPGVAGKGAQNSLTKNIILTKVSISLNETKLGCRNKFNFSCFGCLLV